VYVIGFAILGGRNVMNKKAEYILRYKDLTIGMHSMWNVQNKCDTNNNWVNWNYIKNIHKIPEQHIERAQNLVTTENSHTGQGAHTSESANVKVHNIQSGK
jgi:hypothetical protein